MIPLTITIGYDARQPWASLVCAHSLLRQASCPLSIIPIVHHQLGREWKPAHETSGSTPFAHSRFLSPWLTGYTGYVLYLDGDMLATVDMSEILLYPLTQPGKSVWVVQHDYVPKADVKMWGAENTPYPRKQWSSVMLFDAAQCRQLTFDYVNQATPMDLHRFTWLEDAKIGALPLDWNHLVDEYPHNDAAKLYHYTLGIPSTPGYEHCDHADLWWKAYREMLAPCQG